MSAHSHNTGHAPAGHHGHGDHGHHEEFPHVTRKEYNTGFILSVILTAIPFGLVMSGAIENPDVAAMVVMGFGAVQIIVHMVYFLHMNRKAQGAGPSWPSCSPPFCWPSHWWVRCGSCTT